MCAVEWKCLDEIAIVSIGEFVHKDKQNPNAEYPVYNGGISNTGYYEDFNNTGNKIIISARGANAGYINRVFVNYWAGNSCYSISVTSNDVDWNFLFYYLKTNQQKLIGEQQKGGIPAISKKQICTFKIPIPSLAKQQEIVSHLDTFTTLISNLESELDMRRKQYEHYRNQLLDFEGVEGVDFKLLKSICNVINGRAYKQSELLSEGKYKVLRVGNFFSNDSWYFSDLELEDKYYCLEGDLLYAWSASFGPHIWQEDKTIYHYHIWKMDCNEMILKKYMYYWLQSDNMKKQAFASLHGATMAHLTKVLMENLEVPIPSIKTQQEIVEKLDDFENLIQSLEQEIKLRKQQYEYYREKLLTFEKE